MFLHPKRNKMKFLLGHTVPSDGSRIYVFRLRPKAYPSPDNPNVAYVPCCARKGPYSWYYEFLLGLKVLLAKARGFKLKGY